MEKELKKILASLGERLRSWRPTVDELSRDYRDMSTDWRVSLGRFLRGFRSFAWLGLFFIGVFGGIGLKTVALEYLVIGHGDYRLLPSERLYSLNELREKALDAGARLPVEPRQAYPACGEQREDPSL
ncbi:MAG: hypothetical protein WAT81_05505 [Candidatus Moraniibacteriota bacterium]